MKRCLKVVNICSTLYLYIRIVRSINKDFFVLIKIQTFLNLKKIIDLNNTFLKNTPLNQLIKIVLNKQTFFTYPTNYYILQKLV